MARIEKEIEAAIANDQIYMSELPKPPANATWLEFRQYEVRIYIYIFYGLI